MAAALTVSGCQAFDDANQKAQQIQQGYNEVQKAGQEAKHAKQTAQDTAKQASGIANQAQNEASSAANAVGSGNPECGGHKPRPGETTAEFVNVFLEVSEKDNLAVQGMLYAVQVAKAVVFFDHLKKLANGDATTQAEASCMLDRFYGLIPTYHGQLEPIVLEVSDQRTSEWYELTPAEKIKMAHYHVAGNPFYLLIERDIQTRVPKGP